MQGFCAILPVFHGDLSFDRAIETQAAPRNDTYLASPNLVAPRFQTYSFHSCPF